MLPTLQGKEAAMAKQPRKPTRPARKPEQKEEAFRIVKQITDLVVRLSINSDEREKFLSNPQRYLEEADLSGRAREILGSLNERLIIGQIYDLRPDITPIPVVYTSTIVDVTETVIVTPVSLIFIFLAPQREQ
jgi:hypothetical protein